MIFSLKCFLYFFTSILLDYFAQKTPERGVFELFFYLHADERGKTRSIFHCQTSFPPWPRGKGNCLPTCPRHLTLVLGGSPTGHVESKI